MSDIQSARLDLHNAVLADLAATKPKSLSRALEYQAEALSSLHQTLATLDDFATALSDASATDELVEMWRKRLTHWDYAAPTSWSSAQPSTTDRRDHIYLGLGLDEALASQLTRLIPVATTDRPVVISETFEQWYSPDTQHGRPFYWPHYEQLLEKKGWSPEAIASLNDASDSVVARLSDPTREEAYQAKGLVVGYVQSGKTANFTGVVAKSIDAGYRLVIVLGGTLNMLRGQTQRRLDMELVGRENILRGANEIESDYADDPAWLKGDFASFGELPSALGAFDIVRMTTRDNDYKSLLQGIVALEFEKREPTLPLHDPRNLHRSSARLMVVKKNKSVLTRLVKDLNKIKTPLAEIPVIIIDDESDEASVNTKDLSKPNNERTAINKLIGQLLVMLPRAQYVGYTATPFANVFIDPSDAVDIFPRDFIISLPRPEGYMGVEDFHDLLSPIPPLERNFENSNEKAHIRNVTLEDEDEDDTSLREAVDAFVLAGAMKLYREDHGDTPMTSYTHHTMLIHESIRMADHRELLVRAKRLWFNAGYAGPAGHRRLRELFNSDFAVVSASRSEGYAVPDSYDALMSYIGPAVARIGGDDNPVIVVNGDKDLETGVADFDKRPIWKMLIGGQKLSRGFTVEGLTISYFRRTTTSASTLMQMGRWFGFRSGYKDLVRLYLGRTERLTAKKTVDLYDAFEAICLDEETFRAELKKYANPINGSSQITPAQVPPLVSQHLDWLKPVSPNKMFNARLIEADTAGEWNEPTAYPQTAKDVRHNFDLWAPQLEKLPHGIETLEVTAPDGVRDKLVALTGIITPQVALDIFERYRWANADQFAPHLAFLRSITESEAVADWLLVAPQLTTPTQQASLSSARTYSWFARDRRSQRTSFGAISAPRHRTPLLRIAGALPPSDDPATEALVRPKRGTIALYPIVERPGRELIEESRVFDPGSTVMAFSFVAPSSARSFDGRILRFTTIDSSQTSPVIDAPGTT
ncbi:Z1 domain-containing protein [Tsukamurella pseudospumae]|uniref:Endonuclease n=1 Tax=Tsukamurella pseudospumae TaxID=239498 RepID=A0A137YX72_9ACTN|nr:Z1 domain-containing protein [Tsukamurella pseudospumae]KXO90511.1 endonuclease [Tsukamurella pseudospumae]